MKDLLTLVSSRGKKENLEKGKITICAVSCCIKSSCTEFFFWGGRGVVSITHSLLLCVMYTADTIKCKCDIYSTAHSLREFSTVQEIIKPDCITLALKLRCLT